MAMMIMYQQQARIRCVSLTLDGKHKVSLTAATPASTITVSGLVTTDNNIGSYHSASRTA